MSVDKSKCGLVRPLKPRHPRERQERAVRAAGAQIVFVVPDECSRDDFVKIRRPGDTVFIEALALLAEPKTKETPQPSADLWKAVEAIEKRGAVIVEASTGRKSSDPLQRAKMIDDAIKALAAGGRALPTKLARANGLKGGRPPKTFTDAEMEAAKRVWENRKIKRWVDVKAKLPKGFSTARAWRLWGPRDATE